MAGHPIMQAKVRFLKFDVGEARLLELVGQKLTLDEIADLVDPFGMEGIEKTVLSKFLGGLAKDNTSDTPDTHDEVLARRLRYKTLLCARAELFERRAVRVDRLRAENDSRMRERREAALTRRRRLFQGDS